MFEWLFRDPSPPAPDPYFERMKQLSYFRGQVLACTFSNDPRSPHYFNPHETADLDVAFRQHLEGLWDREVFEPPGLAVVAAGLLTYGRIEMAGYILDHLPDRLIRNGYCNLVGRRVVAFVLPLPEDLRKWTNWIAGTPEAEAVRSWLARNRDALRWQPSSGTFAVAEPTAQPLASPDPAGDIGPGGS